MTTQQLYQKVINEQMTKSEFLWNVRRDDRFSSIITNTMSFEDTVSVLKGKGHVWEASQEAPAVRPFDFIGSMKALNEAAKKDNKLKGGKGDKLDADHVNYHEFTKGWKHELEHTDDIDKAKEIALDHLAEDPNYYTRLDMIEYQAKKSKKKTEPKKTGEGEMVDKENQMTAIDKKKAKSNVKAGLGKQEKAKAKNAGAKVMKGGSGEMKSVKEGVDLDEAAASDIEFKPNVEYIWKIAGREPQSGKLDKVEYEYILSKGEHIEYFDYKERVKDVKAKEVPQSVDITKDPTKFTHKKDNPTKKIDTYRMYSSNKREEEKDIQDVSYDPDKLYLYKRQGDKNRFGNISSLSKDEFDSIKSDPKLVTFRTITKAEVDALDAKTKASVDTSDEPGDKKGGTYSRSNQPKATTAPKEKPDEELFTYEIIPIRGGKTNTVQMTKKQAEKLANKDSFKNTFKIELKSDEPSGKGKATKVVTTYAPGVKPIDQKGDKGKDNKGKDMPTGDIKGVKSSEPRPTSIPKKWQVVDASDLNNPVVIGAFDDKAEAIKMKGNNQRILVLPPLALKKLNLEPLSEAEDNVSKNVKNVNVSFIIPGEGDEDQKLDVSDTVKSAVHNKKDDSFTVNLNGGNRVVFTPDAAGKPVGVYFSKQDGKEVSKQVLDVQPPLNSILNKVYAKKKEESSNTTLENYIRERIRKAILEGEEGQYIGMVGPDVLKKKLEGYMTRYEWGYEKSGNPAKRARGGEIHGIVSKMVHELGQDGVDIFNEYAPEGYQIESMEDLGTDPAYKVGLGPQDRDFNPEELYGRGGRVAEASYDEEDIKRYTDMMDKDINDPNLEKEMASFGEKAMSNAYTNTSSQVFVARVLGEYIARKGAKNIKNVNIINGFHKLADKNK